ncbi:MAG: hypothetical protein NC923_03725 [Candidatus Omnitrophica bacterium]|nr:hypothetical protein [Candidatus Omnitrophota bacterium]
MKISKFLSLSFFITGFCLLYVYQQTEIFRLAYIGQNKQAFFSELLDKNNILRYNIKKNTSLTYIGSKFSGTGDYEIPNNFYLVKVAPPKKNTVFAVASRSGQTMLSRIFAIKRQAEAKTINP